MTDIERERKLQIECWKKRVAFATNTGTHMNNEYEQCIELPRAIATSDGHLVKGTKSNMTKVLKKRYKVAIPPITTTLLPPGWVPDATIVEGMFLINIKLWSAQCNIGEYAEFLLRQHILPHFRNGSKEVHLLFDDPECQEQSLKYFERQHRDRINPTSADHCCIDFTPDLVIPPKWRETVLHCRKCNRGLVCFLSFFFLQSILRKLTHQQRFVTTGGLDGVYRNKAAYVESNQVPQYDPQLTSNVEEADTRIWLHVTNYSGNKKLILSPDTDVYHAGLPYIAGTSLDVIVKVSPFTSLEQHFLDLKALVKSLSDDPELGPIPQLPSAIQMLYVCTGCDYISFFNGFGKALFLATLAENSEFIFSDTESLPGTIANPDPDSTSILSFFRLVGCAFCRKYKDAFIPTCPTSITLFNSLAKDIQTPLAHHTAWLQLISDRDWSRI